VRHRVVASAPMPKAKRAKKAPAKRPEMEYRPVEWFKPDAKNPRKHSPEAVAQLAKAIQTFGFRIPMLAKFSSGDVVDGHFRLKAAKLAGLVELPVMNADDMTELEIRAFRLSVNRMAELADWDEDLLLKELEALDAAGVVLEEEGAVGMALADGADGKLLPQPYETGPVHDTFVVTVTGTLPIAAEVRRRLAGMEGVTIEQSTVERE